MNALSILLVGDTNRAEFCDAPASMARWARVHQFVEIDAAADALNGGEIAPDIIVVAQAFPGQFSPPAIDRLRRLAPLARIVGLMGSWCEGELRSGSPWPATARAYWHQWPVRCDREFRRLAAGECGVWSLPITASEEERLLADANLPDSAGGDYSWPNTSPKRKRGTANESPSLARRASVPVIQPSGLVVIRSPSLEMADWLSAACRRRGLATLWQRLPSAVRVKGAAAAIFDGSDLAGDEFSELQRLVAALHPAPVIVLLSFPRVEHRRLAASAGAAAVLSKPLAMEDLFFRIAAAVSAGR